VIAHRELGPQLFDVGNACISLCQERPSFGILDHKGALGGLELFSQSGDRRALLTH